MWRVIGKGAFLIVFNFLNVYGLSTSCSGNTCNTQNIADFGTKTWIVDKTYNEININSVNITASNTFFDIQNNITNLNLYGNINQPSGNQNYIFKLSSGKTINNLNNYGVVDSANNWAFGISGTIDNFNNYGLWLGGIGDNNNNGEIKNLNSTGLIGLVQLNTGSYHLNTKATISNLHLKITEDANKFNDFSGYGNASSDERLKYSHFVLGNNAQSNIAFHNGAKIYLSFEDDFKFNANYKIEKLITDTSGDKITSLSKRYLFSYLALKNPSPVIGIYRKNDFFCVGICDDNNKIARGAGNTMRKITNLNITKFMLKDDFYHSIFKKPSQTSQISLNDYSKFYYKNKRTIRRANPRPIPRQNAEIPRQDSFRIEQAKSQKYYTFFNPFVSHNLFYDKATPQYSGPDYGFVGGFNANFYDINTLGFHIGFSYGNMKEDEFKTDFRQILGNLGLHYKLDLDKFYFKGRIDGFYFMDEIKYAGEKIKPNNFGFGVQATFGKDFKLNAGIFGIEAGANYNGISYSNLGFKHESYAKSFEHLGQILLNANYAYAINNFNFRAQLGASVLITSFFKNQAQFKLDNEIYRYNIGYNRFGGHIGLGVGYSIKNVELGLEYFGNAGDKMISNSGFFNIRAWF